MHFLQKPSQNAAIQPIDSVLCRRSAKLWRILVSGAAVLGRSLRAVSTGARDVLRH